MTAILSGKYVPLDEMHRLVASSLAGNMSHEERGRLEELVGQDNRSRSLYLDVIHETSILLTWALRGRPDSDAVRQLVVDGEESDQHGITSAPTANSALTFPTLFLIPPSPISLTACRWHTIGDRDNRAGAVDRLTDSRVAA